MNVSLDAIRLDGYAMTSPVTTIRATTYSANGSTSYDLNGCLNVMSLMILS
jgi:hypothetical protein